MGGEKLSSVSATRNSEIRKLTQDSVNSVAEKILRIVPWISPTHINILGAGLVGIGSVIAASRDPKNPKKEKERTLIAAGLLTIGPATDAIDGAIARKKAVIKPSSVNFRKGQLYDALSDRSQEVTTAWARACMANKIGDRIGEAAALGSAITSTLPSIFRSRAESLGRPVAEGGRGILGLIGTRVGRATLGSLATIFPRPKDLPLQPVTDILMTASNVITAYDRFRAGNREGKITLSGEVRDDAKTRLKVLTAFEAVSLAGSLFTYLRLQRKPEQKEKGEADYLGVIRAVEKYCQDKGLDHRIVGGTLTDFIGPQTEFDIDPIGRTVIFRNPNSPSMIRADGTVKDIDMIVFTPDRK